MAKPNYRHAKKQKEAARKARQDAKQQRRAGVPDAPAISAPIPRRRETGRISRAMTDSASPAAYASPWMDEDLAIFRESVSRFVEAEMVPHEEQWRKQQNVGKEIWRKAGALGLLCTDVSAEYGGVGGDFRHEAVLYEELARRGLERLWPRSAQHLRALFGESWHRGAESAGFCRAWRAAN